MEQIGRNLSLWSWAFLLILVPVLFLPPIFTGLALFLILFFVAVRRWTFGYFLPPTPLNLAILGLLAALLVSYLVIFDETLSLPKLAGLLIGIALFFSVVQFSKERSIWPIVVVFVMFGVAIATAAEEGQATGTGGRRVPRDGRPGCLPPTIHRDA